MELGRLESGCSDVVSFPFAGLAIAGFSSGIAMRPSVNRSDSSVREAAGRGFGAVFPEKTSPAKAATKTSAIPQFRLMNLKKAPEMHKINARKRATPPVNGIVNRTGKDDPNVKIGPFQAFE